MDILLYIYIFLLGAALGSFALVVAERWNTKRSWTRGRSQCDSCKKTLQPVDLVPLLSWLLQRGKCRHCGEKVSARYPLAELLSGLMLVLVYAFFPYDVYLWSLGLTLFIIWLFIHTISAVLVLIDLRSMLMPYKFLIPLIGISAVFRFVALFDQGYSFSSAISLLFALLLGGGVFGTLWVVSKGKWIGDSDILLGIVIAFVVGGAVEVWIALIIASLGGLFFGGVSSAVRKKSMRHMKIPFGPFLVLGMVGSFLFSSEIIDTYVTIFLSY